jgi:hypothetical protein
MGDTSLKIKDGSGTGSALSTFTSSAGLIPEHAIYGSVTVTASAGNQLPVKLYSSAISLGGGVPVTSSQAYPLYVTGSVSISQPVNVDLTIADNVSVTSSITNPLYISSSLNSPILVVGTVDLQSNVVTASISGTPTVTLSSNVVTASISGTPTVTLSSNIVTASISGTPTVTLSSNVVTASISGTPQITGTVGVNNFPASFSVTASAAQPVYTVGSIQISSASLTVVTSSTTNPVAAVLQDSAVSIAGTASVAVNSIVTVTSSNLTPLIVAPQKSVADSTRDVHNIYGSINYENYSSGTFVIASSSYDRKGLVISNNSSNNLYVVIGSSSDGPNGFQLSTTASAPLKFSFILYPSGTYFAESVFVSQFHAGFFPSSSDPGWYPETISTKVN